ncbi:HAD family hydrolase [Sphingomonas sp.]|uniref:HAD family hydrolase n=1 Tax=Sphingomonas sp. TaxID=28214 RepID=UPI003B00A910
MKLTVRGKEIAGLLDRAPAGVTVLSLDCFDTLIWRTTHAPHDVFAALDLPGGGVEPRQWAEQLARRVAYNRREAIEIGLEEIYATLMPQADAETVRAHAAAELALEARHAFAFRPVVELIAEAKRRGLTVVIVSDMYLSEAEIRAHIAAAASPDVLAMIDHVFVSGAHGLGKNDGLFDVVLAELGVPGEQVLHVGDNPRADHQSAAKHGLHAVHFQQFDAATEQRLRHEASAAVMIDPAARVTRPVHQPHRAAVSLRASDAPAYALGHDVLGPVMRTFAAWLKGELDAAAARIGRPVKPLFVMRDGWLPFRVFDALYPDAGAATVEISRFVAGRASIHDEASLDRYLGEWLDKLPPHILARHLMLFENEVAPIARIKDHKAARRAFADLTAKPATRAKIVKRCRDFGGRLIAHLARAGVTAGDAVMLVDIGFNGTVQNIVTPVLEDRMGLTVAGRYLFLRETQASGLDKRGMLDVRGFDNRTLHGLSTAVVAVEQLCNVAQGSCVGFDANGAPVREAIDGKAAQSAVRDEAQTGALDFARDADAGVLRPAATDTLDARIGAAAAALTRLFFLPSAEEVTLFGRFDFDANLGSHEATALIDADASGRALRRHGVAFVNEDRRMFLAADLHRQGLPLTLASFAAHRFGLDLRMTDFEVGGLEIGVVLMTATEQLVQPMTAYPTCDGFYRLQVPIGQSRPAVAVQFGALAPWIEIEEIAVERLADESERRPARLVVSTITDGMEAMDDGLWRVAPAGFALIQAPAHLAAPMVMTAVFRPIGRREAPAVRLAA